MAEFDIMYELNRPMIDMSPGRFPGFQLNPVGWIFVGLYLAYVGWTAFAPPSEAEKAFAEKQMSQGEEAKAAAAPFLKSASEAEGAVVQPSGLVYRELEAGSGAAPTPEDSVLVQYTGTLADGSVFDSSVERGQPTEFKVGQVIKGWQEGLQLMKVGGKAVLTIPSDLAYGPQSVGTIPMWSALQFEVELLEIKEPSGWF